MATHTPGQRLLAFRKRHKTNGKRMSQDELAKLVGTHQTTIAALESDGRVPRPDLARRIHAVTGIHPTAWLAAAYESGG